MATHEIIMILGFALAAYSVVGNDSIQTLGTFISSNEQRPWYVLWFFAASILLATLLYGWFNDRPERLNLTEAVATEADGSRTEGYFVSISGQEGSYLHYKSLKDKLGHAVVYASEAKKNDFAASEAVELQVYRAEGGPGTLVAVGQERLRAAGLFSIADVEGNVYELEHAQVRDVSYQRLEKYDLPYHMPWYYVLPPLVLMLITRFGIPVSTSFLILTFFNEKNLQDMVEKSLLGYVVALGSGLLIYVIIARSLERRFIEKPATPKENTVWSALQWASTGFLWSQWLIQDFANIYVYLPRDVDDFTLAWSLVLLVGMLGYIFYQKGGKIQDIVKSKSNTVDIRSATIIDFTYGGILYFFQNLNNVPMSTTWVFLGLLAGREIALRFMLAGGKVDRKTWRGVGMDLAKVFFGLAISIALVYVIKLFL